MHSTAATELLMWHVVSATLTKAFMRHCRALDDLQPASCIGALRAAAANSLHDAIWTFQRLQVLRTAVHDAKLVMPFNH
jgi:hypothetical protein